MTLRNTLTRSVRVRVEFRDSFGAQLPLTFADGRSGWFVEETIFNNGAWVLETTGAGPLKQGFVRLSAPECQSLENGLASFCGAGISGVIGQLRFQQRASGRPPFEATVPLESIDSAVDTAFDNTGGYTTTVAILNPFVTTGQRLRLTFRDLNGGVLAQKFVEIGPRRRTAFALTDYPEVRGKQGTLNITSESGSSIVTLALLFNAEGPFSVLPVTRTPF